METILTWLTNWLATTSWTTAVLACIGASRLVFKSTLTFLELVFKATPTKKDDQIISNFRRSKVYGTILWVLDLLTSIKIKPRS